MEEILSENLEISCSILELEEKDKENWATFNNKNTLRISPVGWHSFDRKG